MERNKIVAGNWKMNKNLFDGKQLVEDVIKAIQNIENHCTIIIAPPFTQLEITAGMLAEKDNFLLAAQNCHQEKSGAFTGEISAEMLQSVGVDCVILGHSERRQYFGEDEKLLAAKIDAVLSHNMKVIYCVGESIEARDNNHQNEVVQKQLEGALYHLDNVENIILAYEPVWAIGTGRTATAEQAQEMHHFIRSVISNKFGTDAAQNISILYGGSCNPKNADSIFAMPDVDGGLIGGASLKANEFAAIIKARS